MEKMVCASDLMVNKGYSLIYKSFWNNMDMGKKEARGWLIRIEDNELIMSNPALVKFFNGDKKKQVMRFNLDDVYVIYEDKDMDYVED